MLDKKGKPFLQGWAIVENTQDEDWTNVRMALVSGRPISFQMDLYQPLYVPRPVVEPELFASLRPPTYQGAMETEQGGRSRTASGRPANATEQQRTCARCPPRQARCPRHRRGLVIGSSLRKMAELGIDLRRASQPSAPATELGDYLPVPIEQPVTLPRQKSALLPIVNEEVEGTKVSASTTRATHAKFPLLGLKFKNTTSCT